MVVTSSTMLFRHTNACLHVPGSALRRALSTQTTSQSACSVTLGDDVTPGLLSVNRVRKGGKAGDRVCVAGWVKSVRTHKSVSFVEVNDGSSFGSLQVVADAAATTNLYTGCSVQVTGELVATPLKKTKTGAIITPKHGLTELLADPSPSLTSEVPPVSDQTSMAESTSIPDKSVASTGGNGAEAGLGAARRKTSGLTCLGDCDPDTYPLQKKGHTLEFMREHMHLRSRSNTFGAVMRARNAAQQGIHDFFQSKEFIQVHTPILTANDCEGAGEMFRLMPTPPPGEAAAAAGSTGAAPSEQQQQQQPREFFGSPAFLTVSGQLQAEMFACSLSKVYTFGPTFRAENSNTSRHLAEFWMVEPEVAFASVDDVIGLAEGCVKAAVGNVLERCPEDMAFFAQRVDKQAAERARATLDAPFARMSYTEAVNVLAAAGQPFSRQVVWGDDLGTEHERFLAEKYCRGPVFVTDYPASLKPFYMRLNDSSSSSSGAPGPTASCVDLLVPGVGEMVGGSAREERYDVLRDRMLAAGLPLDPHQGQDMEESQGADDPDNSGGGVEGVPGPGTTLGWYLELRKYGSVPHAGWGLGFERLVQYVTGLDNIRDTIPIPRTPGSCRF